MESPLTAKALFRLQLRTQRTRPVHQQQINVIRAQLLQRQVDGLHHLFVLVVVDFGGPVKNSHSEMGREEREGIVRKRVLGKRAPAILLDDRAMTLLRGHLTQARRRSIEKERERSCQIFPQSLCDRSPRDLDWP